MPPLPADFIHARGCKPKCEKIFDSTPAGCVALPYFHGRGTPDLNSNAKGAFLAFLWGVLVETWHVRCWRKLPAR